MELILKFAGDFKPDIQIIMGDLINLAGVSDWNVRKTKIQYEEDIEKDFEEGKKFLNEIGKLGSKKIYYLEGNHEDWLRRFGDKFPAFRNKLKVEKEFDLKKRGIEFYSSDKQKHRPLPIGKLDFIHGWYCNKHHTKKTAEEVSRNTIYAHTHDVQIWTKKELANGGSRILVQSIGHLCKEKSRAFDYGKGPFNWMLAFGATYVDKVDGSFTHYTIPVPKYKFIWNGREHKN